MSDKVTPIRRPKGKSDTVIPKHPMQPLILVHDVVRFKENRAVRALYDLMQDKTGVDPWVCIQQSPGVERDDLIRFAQLIGYSHSGSGDLSYMDDQTWEAALMTRNHGLSELEARNVYLEAKLRKIEKRLSGLTAVAFNIDRDDLIPR